MQSVLGFEEKTGNKESVKDNDTSFTWQELRKYNLKTNAHVAVRGKASHDHSLCVCLHM